MVFLFWCGGVLVVVFASWCFCFGVVVFLFWCGGVFVLVFLWWWWCFCGGVMVFLRWCFFLFLWWCFGMFFFGEGPTFVALPRSYAKSVDNAGVKRCLV